MLSDRSFIVLCTVFVGIYLSSKVCLSVSVVSDDDCLSRGRNCSWCLSDGNCGFCDRCGDHCHKPGAIHSLENCTNCASCIPGTLAGSRKNYECRAEWWVNSNDYRSSSLFSFKLLFLHAPFSPSSLDKFYESTPCFEKDANRLTISYHLEINHDLTLHLHFKGWFYLNSLWFP